VVHGHLDGVLTRASRLATARAFAAGSPDGR
jgi:hypothetical protein